MSEESHNDDKNNESKVHSKVAEALLTFVNLDVDGDGVLDFQKVRDAMLEHDLLQSDEDKAIYDGLGKADGNISKKAFVEGLQMLFGEETSSSASPSASPMVSPKKKRVSQDLHWTANTIYRGLKLVVSANDDDEDEDDLTQNRKSREAKSLAGALFSILDIDCNGILTMEDLRDGLMEVDPETFTSDVLDEIIEQLDDSGTTTVNKQEFVECFSNLNLGSSNNMSKVRTNLNKYKKIKNKKKAQKHTIEVAIASVSKEIVDVSPTEWDNSRKIIEAREKELEKQLRDAKKQAERLQSRYAIIKEQTEISRRTSEKLKAEKRQAELRKAQERKEYYESEATYKKMVEDMERRMKSMEMELSQTKKAQEEARKFEGTSSRIEELENDLYEKESKLREATKKLAQEKKTIKAVKKKQKKKVRQLKKISKAAHHADILLEEKERLALLNKKQKERLDRAKDALLDKADAYENFLFASEDGMNFDDSGAAHDSWEELFSAGSLNPTCTPNIFAEIEGPLVKAADFVEGRKEVDETKSKMDELAEKKREMDERIQKAQERLEKKRAEIEAKSKALSEKEKELAEKAKKIDKHASKFKKTRFERTDDPRVYKFGNRTVQVRVLQGELFVKYGSGYIRAPAYAKLCNKVDKKRFQEEREKKINPKLEISPSTTKRQLSKQMPRKTSDFIQKHKAKRKRVKAKMRQHRSHDFRPGRHKAKKKIWKKKYH